MDIVSNLCIYTEIALIAYQFKKSIFSKDVSQIWSPINIISLVYIYYCLIPHFFQGNERFIVDEVANNGYLFHVASLLSYIFILIGFSISSPRSSFYILNSTFNAQNAGIYGTIIFLIGFIGYGLCRGFHFSIRSIGQAEILMDDGITQYLTSLIEIFPAAVALMLCGWKQKKIRIWLLIFIWLSFTTLIFRGSRGRIIMAVIPLLIMWYSYPKPRRINYPVIGSLLIAIYLFFAVMDSSRSASAGIDFKKASEVSMKDAAKGAQENYTVYEFSMKCINLANATGERYYFAPLLTASFMPIPRAIFPWKPDASYMKQIEKRIYGNDSGGAAYLNFIESYLSFGWFGVIFWAWLLGWVARKFWDNFNHNRESIGAIVLLGAFNGMCYIIISRGYLAQSFTSFLYSIFLPFWIAKLIKNLTRKTIA